MKTKEEIEREIEKTEASIKTYQIKVQIEKGSSLGMTYSDWIMIDKSRIAAMRWVLDI